MPLVGAQPRPPPPAPTAEDSGSPAPGPLVQNGTGSKRSRDCQNRNVTVAGATAPRRPVSESAGAEPALQEPVPRTGPSRRATPVGHEEYIVSNRKAEELRVSVTWAPSGAGGPGGQRGRQRGWLHCHLVATPLTTARSRAHRPDPLLAPTRQLGGHPRVLALSCTSSSTGWGQGGVKVTPSLAQEA